MNNAPWCLFSSKQHIHTLLGSERHPYRIDKTLPFACMRGQKEETRTAHHMDNCCIAIITRNSESLGPTYPCTNTVDMEPLSTSQLKVIHQSTCYYHQDLYCCTLRPRSLDGRQSEQHTTLHVRAWRHYVNLVPLTAMHRERAIEPSIFRVTRFGRMSNYTLLSGYRLP